MVEKEIFLSFEIHSSPLIKTIEETLIKEINFLQNLQFVNVFLLWHLETLTHRLL